MVIREVLTTDTPNHGRIIWNENDFELERRLRAFAFNVTASPYQARGDGAENDRPAIQAAIDDCYAAGGGVVYLPSGTYLITDTSLVLRNGILLTGAGMHNTTIQLGNNVNQPVFVDDTIVGRVRDNFSFGRVYVTNLTINGNRENNREGQEGIFTSAFYSVFEQVDIRGCGTHGIRMGFAEMANFSSQNRVVGCRITDCGGAGIYLDINGIDHTITQNYIHDCDYGVVINNGGVRVINNGIFGHRTAAIQVQQTSYGSIIAGNDLNANRRNAIYVTRTTLQEGEDWNQMIITGNSILGDFLESDNQHDAIFVETLVRSGITKLTLVGNKIFSLAGQNRYRYGINLAENVVQTKCSVNHISNIGTAEYHIGRSCSDISIDSIGGGALQAPAMPQNGTVFTNPFHVGVTVYVRGGDVRAIRIQGTETGLTSGSFRLPAGNTITLEYNTAPSWTWFAD